MHKLTLTLVVVAMVACLLVAEGSRITPPGALGQQGPQPGRVRHKRAYYFRGYWSCPLGYIRSPAFMCTKCEEYTRVTGLHCEQ